MILTEKFIWVHLGKTSGKITRLLIKYVLENINEKYSEYLLHYVILPDDPFKKNQIFISNIRRLPSWYLSYVYHRIYHDGASLPLSNEFVEKNYNGWFEGSDGEQPLYNLADNNLRHIYSCGKYHYSFWIRADNYVIDTLEILGKLYVISDDLKTSVFNNFKVSEEMPYNHDVRCFFSEEQIQKIYINNPVWTNIEQQVYK